MGEVVEGQVMAYGHAFVMIAAAYALDADIEAAHPILDHVWESEHGAYAVEYKSDMSEISQYRDQNANM